MPRPRAFDVTKIAAAAPSVQQLQHTLSYTDCLRVSSGLLGHAHAWNAPSTKDMWVPDERGAEALCALIDEVATDAVSIERLSTLLADTPVSSLNTSAGLVTDPRMPDSLLGV